MVSAPGVAPGGVEMYRVVYWTGVTLFVAWIVFSAYSAFNGL
jgi:hypothetical protein